MCLDGINGHVGMNIDGVHGGYGVGQRNLEGKFISFDWRRNYVCGIHGLSERGKEEGDIQKERKLD